MCSVLKKKMGTKEVRETRGLNNLRVYAEGMHKKEKVESGGNNEKQ